MQRITRLDKRTPSPEAEPDDENTPGQAARDVELLWADRQLSPHASSSMTRPAGRSTNGSTGGVNDTSLTWPAVRSPAGTLPGAATADCGKERSEDALPAGAEFLSADWWSSRSAGAVLRHMRERVDLKSPVRENRPPGSVRGAPGNRCPYLDMARTGTDRWI